MTTAAGKPGIDLCGNCHLPLAGDEMFCGECGQRVPGGSDVPAGSAVPEPVVDVPRAPAWPGGGSAETSAGGIVFERNPGSGIPADPRPVEAFQQAAPPSARPSAQPLMFRLAFDENLLKTYETVQLRTGLFKRKRGQGTLYVTDARVVFYAWVYARGTQRPSSLLQQTKLEDISGLSVDVSRGISPGLLMLTAFFAFATVGTLLTVILAPLAVLFLILTVICGIFLVRDAAHRGTVGMAIHSRENGYSPIRFGNHGSTVSVGALARMLLWPVLIFLRSYSAHDVAAGAPAEDAYLLIKELGALIIDLQTRGSTAYEHWGIGSEGERVRSAGAL